MKVTEFGQITPMTLLKKKGARLAVLLKQDLINAPTLKYAVKLYDQVYNQINELLYGLNESEAFDGTGVLEVMSARSEIEDFFSVMEGNDVFNAFWSLDQTRGNTALFKDIAYDDAKELFPLIIRFFDLFYSNDFPNSRERINNAASSNNYENFILESLNNMESTQDAASFSRMRSHFGSKYRGFRRMRRVMTRKNRKESIKY